MALGLLILVASAVCFGLAVYLWGTMRIQRAWPTVPGRIVERGVGERMQSNARYYLPHVKYTYSVAGRAYTNDRVYLVGRVGERRAAVQRLVDALPDPLPVHYNPVDPAHAYLLGTPRWPLWVLLAFGLGTFLWGTGELLVALVPD